MSGVSVMVMRPVIPAALVTRSEMLPWEIQRRIWKIVCTPISYWGSVSERTVKQITCSIVYSVQMAKQGPRCPSTQSQSHAKIPKTHILPKWKAATKTTAAKHVTGDLVSQSYSHDI